MLVPSTRVETPSLQPLAAMSTPPAPLQPARPLSSYGLPRPRRTGRVLPWILLALVWGVAAALLVLGTEAAPLVASLAG